jgi:hypothetical protein
VRSGSDTAELDMKTSGKLRRMGAIG